MIIFVTNAKYLEDYKIWLLFNNEIEKIVDLEETILNDNRKVFLPLRNTEYFKDFKIEYDTICWDNNLDLAPEFLFSIAENVDVCRNNNIVVK